MSEPRDDDPKSGDGRGDRGRDVTAEMLALFDPDPDVAGERYLKLFKELWLYADRHYCPNPDDAAQETILRALRNADKIEPGPDGLRRFAFGIVKHVIQEMQRRARLQPLAHADSVPDTPIDANQHELAEYAERLRQLKPLLEPAELTTLLRYDREDDHTAHCETLGVTRGSLRVTVHRLRRKLEARLNKGNPGAGRGAPDGRKKR